MLLAPPNLKVVRAPPNLNVVNSANCKKAESKTQEAGGGHRSRIRWNVVGMKFRNYPDIHSPPPLFQYFHEILMLSAPSNLSVVPTPPKKQKAKSRKQNAKSRTQNAKRRKQNARARGAQKQNKEKRRGMKLRNYPSLLPQTLISPSSFLLLHHSVCHFLRFCLSVSVSVSALFGHGAARRCAPGASPPPQQLSSTHGAPSRRERERRARTWSERRGSWSRGCSDQHRFLQGQSGRYSFASWWRFWHQKVCLFACLLVQMPSSSSSSSSSSSCLFLSCPYHVIVIFFFFHIFWFFLQERLDALYFDRFYFFAATTWIPWFSFFHSSSFFLLSLFSLSKVIVHLIANSFCFLCLKKTFHLPSLSLISSALIHHKIFFFDNLFLLLTGKIPRLMQWLFICLRELYGSCPIIVYCPCATKMLHLYSLQYFSSLLFSESLR